MHSNDTDTHDAVARAMDMLGAESPAATFDWPAWLDFPFRGKSIAAVGANIWQVDGFRLHLIDATAPTACVDLRFCDVEAVTLRPCDGRYVLEFSGLVPSRLAYANSVLFGGHVFTIVHLEYHQMSGCVRLLGLSEGG